MLNATGWMLSAYVVMVTHLLLRHRCTCEGALHCVCTTVECRRDRMSSCQAERMCYEQRMSDNGLSSRSPGGQANGVVIRGCIDDSNTPLLCRNQRPSWFSGSWPLLRCCTQDWCNRPSATTDTVASGNEPQEVTGESDENEYYDEDVSMESSADDRGPIGTVADHPKKTSESSGDHRQRSSDLCDPSSSDPLLSKCPNEHELTRTRLNLLYVLVPVSGACALLALCATAFVILKRDDSPQSYRGSNPSDVRCDVDVDSRNVLERDRLRKDLEKNVFRCHRKCNGCAVTDARKNRKDPIGSALPRTRSSITCTSLPRTYIDSRIFTA